MGKLLELLFSPPPLPPVDLPQLIPGAGRMILEAFKLAYYQGVYDGAAATALVMTLLLLFVRGRAVKGVPRVADHR